MNSELNSYRLKSFVKHLCIVTKRYYERENAKKSLDMQLRKIKKTDDVEKEISNLNKKINLLLEKETRVAELGFKKGSASLLQRKLVLLQQQLAMTQSERDKLTEENELLKQAVDSVSDIRSAVDEVEEKTGKADAKVERIGEEVDKKYRAFLIKDLKEKIVLLESTYKSISKDKSISPTRLFKIEDKIKYYKEKLNSINLL